MDSRTSGAARPPPRSSRRRSLHAAVECGEEGVQAGGVELAELLADVEVGERLADLLHRSELRLPRVEQAETARVGTPGGLDDLEELARAPVLVRRSPDE